MQNKLEFQTFVIMQLFLHTALEQVFLVLNVSLCILTESAECLFNKRQTELILPSYAAHVARSQGTFFNFFTVK